MFVRVAPNDSLTPRGTTGQGSGPTQWQKRRGSTRMPALGDAKGDTVHRNAVTFTGEGAISKLDLRNKTS